MKLKNLLTAIAFVAVSTGAFAQSLVAPIGDESIDTVTVGSRAEYAVNPDPVIKAFPNMDPSIFNWSFDDGTTVLDASDNPATDVGGGFYADSLIHATMAGSPGQVTLTVQERTQPQSGTGCDGDTESLTIQVVPRATIDFSGATSDGACGAQDYSLDLDLTGFGPWDITYDIDFDGSDLSNGNTATVGSLADNVGTGGTSAYTLDIATGQLNQGAGTYTITITNVVDRIGDKSLDPSLVAAQAGDLPGSDYTLYVYPTPDTSPIQHIENVY
ncbi:MAG: hypothetical protein GVY19_01605 [Bacteroidetes bacterium]|jgi:hypothetical protein|nr:hypothetical protein [Bacteroidota bacterium]